MTGERYESVKTTLERVAAELSELSLATERVQHVVGDVLPGASPLASRALVELQDLDRIRQSLSGLAEFILTLSDSIPETEDVDVTAATKSLLLRDLAARLRDGDAFEQLQRTRVQSTKDECELF